MGPIKDDSAKKVVVVSPFVKGFSGETRFPVCPHTVLKKLRQVALQGGKV
jgi:hypothetical protein